TATELRRWKPTTDFDMRGGFLELTRAGKRRCEDGNCWNTQAILDLQHAPDGAVILGDDVLDADNLRRELAENFREQQRCERRRGGRKRERCVAERHELELASVESGACDTVFTFHATSPNGKP